MISRRDFSRVIGAAGLAGGLPLQMRANGRDGVLFQHGVASGDPLADRVILWTRISPPPRPGVFPVQWEIATDPEMKKVLDRGIVFASPVRDFTVKVDATGLMPGTTYYYRFDSLGEKSPVGRTKTLPYGGVDQVRFGVASCSNYPFGFFNAYGAMARRLDLDCILHLGDYIYEYGNGTYGDGSAIGRIPSPDREIVTMQDYRLRYAQYRKDADLQELHRQHPFIVVWDDHESANNAWQGGAENHQLDEGLWAVRKQASIRVWYEWMPVRETAGAFGRIYRSFPFGDLVDLTMLDTRLIGRDEQVLPPTSPGAVFDESRQLIGGQQEAWLFGQLAASVGRGTQWRVIGQQVMMGQLINTDGTPFSTDQWDGYVAARNRVLGYIAQSQTPNVVVLTGDLHSSWGNDLTFNPFDPTLYNGATGAGSVAVEFVGPGITSPGIPDPVQAAGFEQLIRATHPHVRYVNLFRRGYMVVDVNRSRAQADWYYPDTVLAPSTVEEHAVGLQTLSGLPTLRPAPGESQAKDAAPAAP